MNLTSFALSEDTGCLLLLAVNTRKRKWDQCEKVS